jgi:hypothetical protein
MRDVEERDYDHESADDLPKIGEVAEIHGFQLELGGRLRSIGPTYVDSGTELRFDSSDSLNCGRAEIYFFVATRVTVKISLRRT